MRQLLALGVEILPGLGQGDSLDGGMAMIEIRAARSSVRCGPALDRTFISIGRASTSDLLVTDSQVSNIQTFIHVLEEGDGVEDPCVWVQDRDSRNGTFINGKKIISAWGLRKFRLKHDTLTVGRTPLRFVDKGTYWEVSENLGSAPANREPVHDVSACGQFPAPVTRVPRDFSGAGGPGEPPKVLQAGRMQIEVVVLRPGDPLPGEPIKPSPDGTPPKSDQQG